MADSDEAAWPHDRALTLVSQVCTKAAFIGKEAMKRGQKLTLHEAFALALEQADYTDKEREAIWATLLLTSQAVVRVSWRDIQTLPNSNIWGEEYEAD